ncbi:MAG: hypothetical protein MI784_15235 [Cytophagales bacterium]|nr:hypothetical protein [Cytophagales bacterium]
MNKSLTIRWILALSFLALPLISRGQINEEGSHEARIQAMRIGFYTDLLKLSPDDATKFWPLFNAYTKEKALLDKKQHEIFHYTKSHEKIKEKTAKEKLAELKAINKNIKQLNDSYDQKFSTVLSSSQLLKLKAAEFEFNRFLLHKFKRRRMRMHQNMQEE